MNYAVSSQVITFFYACGMGCLLCILFDVFRAIRICFKNNTVAVFIEDVIYFIIATVCLFIFVFIFGEGQLRFFVFVGAFLGFNLYFFTVSVKLLGIFSKIVNWIKKWTIFSKRTCKE
jgi:spore cortex biosynthesis protein YabQ